MFSTQRFKQRLNFEETLDFAMSSARRAARTVGHLVPEAALFEGDKRVTLIYPSTSSADFLLGCCSFSAVEETLQHGGELVAKVLQAHGVKFVFTLTGGHISPILTSSENLGIRVIDVRHEVPCPCPPSHTHCMSAPLRCEARGCWGVTAGPCVFVTALRLHAPAGEHRLRC